MLRRIYELAPGRTIEPETSTPAEDIVMIRVKESLRGLATLLSVVFVAGAFGGLVYFFIGPLFEALRIFDVSHVQLHYELDWPSLYEHVTWGGAWGLIFLLSLPKSWHLSSGAAWQFWVRGLLYGLVPALVEIFLIYPHDGYGIGGVELGGATPVYVLLFDTLFWSLPAYAWLALIAPEEASKGVGYQPLAPGPPPRTMEA